MCCLFGSNQLPLVNRYLSWYVIGDKYSLLAVFVKIQIFSEVENMPRVTDYNSSLNSLLLRFINLSEETWSQQDTFTYNVH